MRKLASQEIAVARQLIAVASVVILMFVLGGCPRVEQPQAEVSFEPESGRVLAPGATIVHQGTTQQDEATVAADGLVGIVKNGEAFLYHPSLGAVELSENNSRRALGYFIATRMKGGLSTAKSRNRCLAIDESESLATGLDVTRTEDAIYTFVNNKKRWAAVLSPASDKPVFLEPRGALVEINAVGALAGVQDFITILDKDTADVPVDSQTVKTFGAIVRLCPVVNMPASYLYRDLFLQKAQEGLSQDRDLFLKLNAIEFLQITIDAANEITGLATEACADSVLGGVILNTFETAGVGVLTGDPELIQSFTASATQDFAVNYALCACEVAGAVGSGGTATAACITVKKVLDIIGTLSWIIDDSIIGFIDELTTDAYAEVAGVAGSEPQNVPIALAQSVSVDFDTPRTITLVANDLDRDPLTYSIVSAPAHGALSGSAPEVTYTPNAGYSGPDSFTFRAHDGQEYSNVATVSITVRPRGASNETPVAQGQSVSVAFGTATPITLSATDQDNGPQALSYSIVAQPDHGDLTGTPPTVTYAPDAGYSGLDSFTFKAFDGQAYSNVATVMITVLPEGTQTGSLNVTVKNSNNQTVLGAIVQRYDTNWVYIDQQTTNASGVASWIGISATCYNLEAWYYSEYWVNDTNACVPAGGTQSQTLTRNEPYCYAFKVFRTDTNVEVTGGSVSAGTPLRLEVQVTNDSPVARSVRVQNLRLDQSQSSPYDYEWNLGSTTIGAGSNHTFTQNVTPSSTGTYYREFEIETSVNGIWDKTDDWSWAAAVTTATTPWITVTAPNGGETWTAGSSATVQWSSGGGVGNVKIDYSTNSGSTWTNLVASTANDGSEAVTVPGVSSAFCRIRVQELDGSPSDLSDADFTIMLASFTVTAPNGGESWQRGTTHTITWNWTGSDTSVWIALYKNGVSQGQITGSAPNNGSYSWPIPETGEIGNDFKIRVIGNQSGNGDYSDSNFSLTGPPGGFTVTAPNGGESWQRGTTHTITWNWTGNDTTVWIALYKNGVSQGQITGSTTNSGSYSWDIPEDGVIGNDFKIRVVGNQSGAGDDSDKYFSLTGPVTGSFTVTTPNGGESWQRGTTHTITWDWTGNDTTVWIALYKNGVSQGQITSSTANDGSYSWDIPENGVIGNDFKIRVVGNQSGSGDDSDGNFTLTGPVTGSFTVTSPNGGESWQRGTTHTITWDWTGGDTTVWIALYKNGVSQGQITSSTANDGSYSWAIPANGVIGNDFKIRVVGNQSGSGDYSDNNFTLTGSVTGSFTVTSPNGGESWHRGTTHTITWTWTGGDTTVWIALYKNGVSQGQITSSAPNNGSYSWAIPANGVVGNDFKIRVVGNQSGSGDYSDNFFTLY